jgi:cell division protein FtsB
MTSPQVSRTTKIILFVEFFLLAYMLYVLSTSLYKSYQIDRFIQTAEMENAKLEKANASLIEDYEYYRSDAYKEKIAKQNFGLVRPGEEVIIIAPDDRTPVTDQQRTLKASQDYYESLSNPRKWFYFFFDRERFS